jgi:CheY-like chemotaxis protein
MLFGTVLDYDLNHMTAVAGNVLIVEDDPDVREMLSALLSTEGFHAVAAEDGLEALHLLRAVRHRAPEIPCLILLDLKMPPRR